MQPYVKLFGSLMLGLHVRNPTYNSTNSTSGSPVTKTKPNANLNANFMPNHNTNLTKSC